LDTLKKIKISELKLQTHHVGRYLLVKVTLTEHKKLRMMAVIQDEDGGAAFMQLCNQEEERDRPAITILDKDMIFAIKQPYFIMLEKGVYLLRVDQDSDILRLKIGDSRIPVGWRSSKIPRSALQWKNVGNNTVKAGKYWDAISE
jgi:hypothetical protein